VGLRGNTSVTDKSPIVQAHHLKLHANQLDIDQKSILTIYSNLFVAWDLKRLAYVPCNHLVYTWAISISLLSHLHRLQEIYSTDLISPNKTKIPCIYIIEPFKDCEAI
jgi:hypothetical protein